MKKINRLILAIIISVGVSAAAQAQISAGAALIYGSEVEEIGLRVEGGYGVTDKISVNADLGFYLPETTDFFGTEFTTTFYEINVNGHYSVLSSDTGLKVYGLAGLNLFGVRVAIDGGDSDSDTEAGLNIGAGGSYGLGFGDVFGELKYVLGDADQLGIAVGVRLGL